MDYVTYFTSYLDLVFYALLVFIITLIIGVTYGIFFIFRSRKNPDVSKKRKYRWLSLISFLLPFILTFFFIITYPKYNGIPKMDYSGQVSDQKIDSIPATIKEPTLLDAQLPAELWDRITKATNSIEAQFNSYEDTAGNIYLMEQAIGGPGWLCKVYYVSDDNYQMVNVETNNVDCGGLYADNNGNWFLLNGGDLYKLEGAKALYIPSLHFNDLSYDSNTNTWYGRTIDTTNAPNDIYTYYKINFGDN